MKKLKVMTVVGTRPEFIRLSRVIPALEDTTQLRLVHTGQNFDFELSQVFFDELGIRKPDYFLGAARRTVAETIGCLIAQTDALLAKEKPDALLVLGDTNSCLSAYPAKRRKIPVFHMEAGNRCFDERVPEEINRRIIDHISDINMPYSEHARQNLLREGIRPETIIKTGSPMKEVLAHYRDKISGAGVVEQLGLSPREYFLVSAHREENIDSPTNLCDLLESLGKLARRHAKRIIVSTHPRTSKKLATLPRRRLPAKVEFLKPLGFLAYVKLQMNALCVLSDSGTLTEESALLGFPAVMIRQAHERPEGMDEGIVIMSGLDPDRVLDSVGVAIAHYSDSSRPFAIPFDYTADNVSRKVVRVILGYTDYVNRTVWRR